MIERLKRMLGFNNSKLERPSPDPITAEVVIATQRNVRASENARNALSELLNRNDGLQGHHK